ncbi:MAG: Flp pilus assembly complex ATPase component TadA [Deltaproteobacteria bacterium]|nr:Flp pilus assembly complex ATPase component TadA [Deltaproteobacteria bacterium]
MSRNAFQKLWDEILQNAVDRQASDIHLGPESEAPHDFILNFRIVGLLVRQESYSHLLGALLLDHLKQMSSLDIAEHSLPQDGSLSISVADFRVSTLPCLGGEKAVLRVLKRNKRQNLASLGIPTEAELAVRTALQKNSGLIVIAGATGSGKTSTVHALLSEIDTLSLNVMTLEDPVEYRAARLSQVQISKHLTFATGLRSILRQDPDVIFVGECRDAETANLAIEASGTGHLVLTTVHTGHVEHIAHRFEELDCDKVSLERVLLFTAFQQLVPSPQGLNLDFQWKSYL